MTGTEHDEALAKALHDLECKGLGQGVCDWVDGHKHAATAVRAAGWVPLPEVEEALRALTEQVAADPLSEYRHGKRSALHAAADLVASLHTKLKETKP